jgi:hypothetical protein
MIVDSLHLLLLLAEESRPRAREALIKTTTASSIVRRGRPTSPLMMICHRRRRGVGMSRAWTSNGAACPGRPIFAAPGGGGELDAAVGAGPSRERRGLQLAVGGPPRPGGSKGDPLLGGPWWFMRLRGRRDPPHRDDLPRRSTERDSSSRHSFNDVEHPDSDSLRRHSSSKARSTPPASAPSVPQGGNTSIPQRRLQSLVLRGGGVLAVQVPLSAGGSQETPLGAAAAGRAAPSRRWIDVPPPS